MPERDAKFASMATLFSAYQPIERYTKLLGRFYGDELAPAVSLNALDAYLMRQIVTYQPTASTIVDFAADATLGASTLVWTEHPQVRQIIAPRLTQEYVPQLDWRALIPRAIEELAVTKPPIILPDEVIDRPGGWEGVRAALPPLSPVVFVLAETEAQTSTLAQRLAALFEQQHDALVMLVPLGALGESTILEAALAFSTVGGTYRLTALREVAPFFAASQLGMIYRRDNTLLPTILERLHALYEGNFQFLALAEAVTASALREEELIATGREEVARIRTRLGELEGVLPLKDRHIADLETSLRQVTDNKDHHIANLEARLEASQHERQRLAERLRTIQARASWQLLERAWHAQVYVAPPDSPQGKIWMAATRVARRGLRLGRTNTKHLTSDLASDDTEDDRVTIDEYDSDPYGAWRTWLTSMRMIRGRAVRQATPTALSQGLLSPAAYNSYESWVRRCEEIRYNAARAARTIEGFTYLPVISIVMPTYNSPPEYLRAALDSVMSQYYPHWELCICDDASPEEYVRTILSEYAARDSRIHVIFSEHNRGIGGASNQALSIATGEYIGLLDHDDVLTPDALLEVVAALQEVRADFLYSDEDKLDLDGRRCEPFLKPGWSPDLLLTCMYTSHFSVYRSEIVEAVGGFRETVNGSQDYDLALRITERVSTITHIPKILYHWRKIPGSAAANTGAKPYAYLAAQRALTDTLDRRGITGTVEIANAVGYYHVRRAFNAACKVSIIIPTRDQHKLLERCIRSIEEKTEYPNYEIIIVDNDSREAAMRDYLARSPHRVIHHPGVFNYSQLNNIGARQATGEYLLLLNNDTEILSGSWLSALVEQAQRPEVGAVGAKLLYPDGRIQHAGVVLGLGGVASHAQRFVDGYTGTGYFNYPNALKNYSAVTGACLMVRRAVFEASGGLNEQDLPINFNDVDFCLRLREQGYLIVYTPYCLVRHHESATREPIVDPAGEAYMLARWQQQLLSDIYYHPQFDLSADDFTIDVSRPDSLQRSYMQPLREAVTSSLKANYTIGQAFTVGEDALAAVGVQFATYGRACNGRVTFHLRRSRSATRDIATVELDAAHIVDNQLHLFTFDPIMDSAGERYYFFLEFAPATKNETLALWKSHQADALMGNSYEQNSPTVGTLAFSLYGRKQLYRPVTVPTTVQ
jgi:GT2 family glycosyltransferase